MTDLLFAPWLEILKIVLTGAAALAAIAAAVIAWWGKASTERSQRAWQERFNLQLESFKDRLSRDAELARERRQVARQLATALGAVEEAIVTLHHMWLAGIDVDQHDQGRSAGRKAIVAAGPLVLEVALLFPANVVDALRDAMSEAHRLFNRRLNWPDEIAVARDVLQVQALVWSLHELIRRVCTEAPAEEVSVFGPNAPGESDRWDPEKFAQHLRSLR